MRILYTGKINWDLIKNSSSYTPQIPQTVCLSTYTRSENILRQFKATSIKATEFLAIYKYVVNFLFFHINQK